MGMRALAPRSQQAGGREWQWRMPRRNLSSLTDPCWVARNRTTFAMTQHFTKLGDTPFWHLGVPKGAEMTSLLGEMPFAPLPAGFRGCYGRHCLNTTN